MAEHEATKTDDHAAARRYEDVLEAKLDQCRADLATAERDHVEAGDRADALRRRLEHASDRAHDARCREVAMREERDALRAEVERLTRERGEAFREGARAMDHPYRIAAVNAEAESARLSARVRELEDALWRCVELTGDDVSDGRPGPGSWPPLHERAIREVKRLRRESEEGYDQDIAQARAEGARQERERLLPLLRRARMLFPVERPEEGGDPEFVAAIKRDVRAAVLSDDEGGRA